MLIYILKLIQLQKSYSVIKNGNNNSFGVNSLELASSICMDSRNEVNFWNGELCHHFLENVKFLLT